MNLRSILLSLSLFSGSYASVAQTGQTVQGLIENRSRAETTLQAAANLLQLAQVQQSVYLELSSVLPSLLLRSTDVVVVQSEAELAGKLKLESATSVLVQLLDQPNQRATLATMTTLYELRDDPVARALFEIGGPAVQPLSTPLESAKVDTRTRAARVLVRINTPESFSLLRQHVDREVDAHLKSYITANLALAKQRE